MTYQIAIIGASGYTGAELIRLVAEHPSMKIKNLIANNKAGQSIEQVFPHLRHLELPDLVTVSEVDFSSVDLAFCALPHKTSQEVISVLPKSLKIVDFPQPDGPTNATNSPGSISRFIRLRITGPLASY